MDPLVHVPWLMMTALVPFHARDDPTTRARAKRRINPCSMMIRVDAFECATVPFPFLRATVYMHRISSSTS